MCRPGDDGGVRRFGMCHPDRHGQWSAIREPHHIIGFIVSLIEPDDGQGLRTQRMESVVDRHFRGAMLMGSMWISCWKPVNTLTVVVPEPSPFTLLATGLILFGFCSARRRVQAKTFLTLFHKP